MSSWYDKANPVVRMKGRLVATEDNSITIHVSGEKLRECKFLTMNAYKRVDGALKDANLKRAAGVTDGSSKPIGSYDLGLWVIYPAGAQ